MYKFTINGNPLGKQRAAPGRYHRMYTPKKTQLYMDKVAEIWIRTYGGITLHGPLAIDIKYYIKRPKTHYGTGKNKDKLKLSAPYWCLRKPDNDNVEKIVWDGLNGVAFIDDSIVVLNRTQKFWTNSRRPRVEVTIYKLTKD